MKKIYFTLCLLLCAAFVFSQEISLKYGKITDDELKMTTYDKDTTAVAVVLYEDGYTSYTYNNTVGFQVILDIKKKVKILKQEGVSEADISIPYYKSGNDKETVSNLDATAYNIEKGKVIKTKLEKKYIFDEEINNRYHQVKFSIPNVKEGTVIEYKYRITSPYASRIPDWNVQSHIPVMNSYYEVLIPEYYHFKIDAAKGFERIQVEETKQNQNFNIGYSSSGQAVNVTSDSRLLKFRAKDMPALKDEPYVWYLNDYISGVRFELSGTKFPNDFYKPYTSTWQNIEETLKEKTDFGSNVKMANPYKTEVKTIVEESVTEEEIITKIYALIKEKIRWNESYSFWGNNARDAVKNGTGDNGQINMVLLSMLKDAKINAYPVLISRRNYGRLPYTHPSLDKLNTFLVAAETSDGKSFYMDGSAVRGGLNVLPVNLLVDRGWPYNNVGGEKWVNLTNLAKNQQLIAQKASIDENGKMTSEMTTRYNNQIAYNVKSDYFSAKDSVEYLENFQDKNNLTVDSYVIEGIEPMSNTVSEKMTYTKNYEIVGNYIYINPLIFTHLDKNPFTQSERKLPIEFNYPYTYISSIILTIPDGYEIEELPSILNMSLPENAGKCTYLINRMTDNTIQLNYRFDLNKIIFIQSDYELIKEFFGKVASKNTELVVLKKI
ncbi:DUF3857 domain-containing protein [Paludibacter sp. 221]|uniref:DUF3857 domain-containing protein n=1 Tax=Paludibacter sp. 221 TaxID=2302939 RepID=UPI0013D7F6CF|nr:DUF3857 domain-containing protein [Paludibacter sp. 221]NDV47482.1 DUF3857 domain-containing protein [Paludibacter sp. 221]